MRRAAWHRSFRLSRGTGVCERAITPTRSDRRSFMSSVTGVVAYQTTTPGAFCSDQALERALGRIKAAIAWRQELRNPAHQNRRVIPALIARQDEGLSDDDADMWAAEPKPRPPELFLPIRRDRDDGCRR